MYSEKISAHTTGSILKEATCELCGTRYTYRIERTGVGRSVNVMFLNPGAERAAEKRADDDLARKLEKAVDPVACPTCGWFQADMVEAMKKSGFKKLAITCGIIAGVGVIFTIFTAGLSLLLAPGLAAAGLASGTVYYYLCNPNADHAGPGTRHADKAWESRGKKATSRPGAPRRYGM